MKKSFFLFNWKCEKMTNNSSFYELWIGSNSIQFCPSKIYGNQLTSGRIAYMTLDPNDNRAESLYKEMKKYIKKNYKNQMRAFSNMSGAEQMYYDLYYTNEVANWVIENPENQLVQFKDGFVRFIPVIS